MNDEPIPLEDEIYEEEIEVEEEPSVMMAMWGEITGDIDNQTDLKEALDAKQNNLTQAQLDAVNSGIDSTKVSTYDGYQAQINTKASQSALDAEAEARRQADSTLQGNIDAEETARKASDKDIQDVLDGETLARQNADIALGGRIDTEIHDRQVADIGLQGQIDAITSKSDVVDVVATYADLQAYDTKHLGDNDVIKVLDDETHDDALTYYRWSKTNQTWTFIGQEAPYYSKSQTDTLLLAKQNTIDSSHKLSADLVTDTSTTNKFVTASDITNWNAKQDALTAGTGIDITSGIISTPAIVPEVVTELPTTGAEGKLYLTPKAHTTQTATGNPIEATITDDAGQLESFKLDGDTFQQSYTGKNLLNLSASRDFTSGTDYSFDASSGVLTVTMSSAPAVNRYSGWRITGITAGAKYTFSIESFTNTALSNTDRAIMIRSHNGTSATELATLNKTQTSYTFTAPNDSVRLDFFFYIASGDTDSTSIITKPMLEAGETATTYEPFVGGQASPSPEYPQPIQTVTGEQTVTVISKNLFSVQNLTDDSRVSTSNGDTYGREGYDVSDYIKIEPSTTYALTCGNAQNGSYFSWYDSTKTYISGSGWQNKTAKTSPANAAYIRFDFLASEVGIVQFEKGSVSSYVPYSSVSYPINLGSIELCKLGTYQDYIWKDGDDWKVHKATKRAKLGDLDWGNYQNVVIYADHISEVFGIVNLGNPTLALVSNIFKASNDSSFTWRCYYNGQNDHLNTYGDSAYTNMSGSDAKQWLTDNNAELLYALATPTDTTITDTTLIAQLEAIRTAILENGTNTITNTATGTNLAGDMEIGYFGFNPTNRYDKFIWLDLNNNYEQIGGE